MAEITTTSAFFNNQGIPTNTPNIINPADILNHTHKITVTDTTGLQGFPDFSRIQLMYSGSEYYGNTWKQFHKFPIFKINKPGYLYYQQFRYYLDVDVVCQLSDDPYNFLNNYNYGNLYNYNYAKLYGNTNNKAYNLPLNDNSNKKTIYWGDALAGGDTYQTKYFPIYPGNKTYCLFVPIRASHSGLEFVNFYFVPLIGSDPNQSYFTKVGQTMYWNQQNYYQRATLASLGRSIFGRNGTSNTTKIKAFQCSGTEHNWNSRPHDAYPANIGHRYYLINPNSPSTQHVYQMQHYHQWQIAYNNDANKKQWCFYQGNGLEYVSQKCDSTVDPWNVTWATAPGYQSWTKFPVLTKCQWL